MAFAIGCALFASVTGTAFAAIEEVTITAEKREETLLNTPIAISALSGETLKNMGVTSFEGVAKASPSISFTPYPSSSNVLILYMRGQGVSDPMQITSDGSVGLYSDGFYISRPQASTFDLADIERVEVLRGPQGTLYGRNTTGGAVNLISKKPSGEFGFKQDLTFGTRDYFRSLTTIDLPKWNDISAKISYLKSDKDGFVKNTGSSHDYGEESQQAGRLSLRWQASDSFTVDYFMEKGSLDSTPVYYQNADWAGVPMPLPGSPIYPNARNPASKTWRDIDLDLSTSDFESHGLTLTWDINDSLTIKSLTGYRELSWTAYQDYADTFAYLISTPIPQRPAPIYGLAGNITPLSATSYDVVHDHQFSQEFQFIGRLLDDTIKYVAGLYYFEEGSSHFERYAVPTFGTVKDRDVSADSKSMAAYAQVTWTPPILDNKLDVTVGGRYTKDEREADRSFIINGTVLEDGATPIQTANTVSYPYLGLPSAPNGAKGDSTFKRFNPALTVNYNWNDDISTYAKISTGYKAGGFSESTLIGHFEDGFSPEKVRTLELGLKSYWFDRRARLNVALFQSKFDDMQLAFTADPNDSSVVQSLNAGKATVNGAEVELLLQPIDDLTLSIDYAYLDPKFDKVEALKGTVFDPDVNLRSPYKLGDNVKDVFSLPYAPKNTVNLGADYTFYHFDKGNLSAHFDYHFQSHMFDTATTGKAVPGRENYEVPSYGVVNGRFTLAVDLPRGDKAKISVWGKNIFDKKYPTQVIGMGNGVDTPDALGGTLAAGYYQSVKTWAEPPSYGVDVSYQY